MLTRVFGIRGLDGAAVERRVEVERGCLHEHDVAVALVVMLLPRSPEHAATRIRRTDDSEERARDARERRTHGAQQLDVRVRALVGRQERRVLDDHRGADRPEGCGAQAQRGCERQSEARLGGDDGFHDALDERVNLSELLAKFVGVFAQAIRFGLDLRCALNLRVELSSDLTELFVYNGQDVGGRHCGPARPLLPARSMFAAWSLLAWRSSRACRPTSPRTTAFSSLAASHVERSSIRAC